MTSPGTAAAEIPLPVPNPDNAGFWEACGRGELRLQRCRECGAFRHHPRPMCPACGSLAFEWARASGHGVVHSFTIVHGPTLAAFQDRVPYNVIVVDLAEGVFMVSNLVDCPSDQVRIDMPVEVVFERVSGELSLPRFRPRRE